MNPHTEPDIAGASLELQRLGVVMEPEIGNPLEAGGVLNPTWKAAATIIDTCPMHPEIEQDHPGDCPKRGMTLVLKSVVPEDEAEDDHELKITAKKILGSRGAGAAGVFTGDG